MRSVNPECGFDKAEAKYGGIPGASRRQHERAEAELVGVRCVRSAEVLVDGDVVGEAKDGEGRAGVLGREVAKERYIAVRNSVGFDASEGDIRVPPPGRARARIVPRCSRAIHAQIARPSPAPASALLGRSNSTR